MQTITIAIIANDQTLQREMSRNLGASGYDVTEYDYRTAGMTAGLEDAYVACMGITDRDGLRLLERWSAANPDLPIIVYGPEHIAESAAKNGAYDVVSTQSAPARLVREVRHAVEKRNLAETVDQLRTELTAREHGASDAIVPLRELEYRAIMRALQATQGSVTKAAKLLGIGRATLYRRLASPEFARLRPRRGAAFEGESMHAPL